MNLKKKLTILLSILTVVTVVIFTFFGLASLGYIRPFKGNITVTNDPSSATYNGESITSDKGRISSGSLIYGDYIDFEETVIGVDAGIYEHKVNYKIRSSTGQDVTRFYNVTENFSEFTIEKLRLEIQTGTDIFPNTDQEEPPYSCKEYTIKSGYLPSYHIIEANDFKTTNTSTVENTAKFEIYLLKEETKTLKTFNFNIDIDYGLLIVLDSGSGGGGSGTSEYPPKTNVSAGGSDIGDPKETEGSYGDGTLPNVPIFKVSGNKAFSQLFLQHSYGDYNKKGFDIQKNKYKPKHGYNPNSFIYHLLNPVLGSVTANVEYLFKSTNREMDYCPAYANVTASNHDVYTVLSDLKSQTYSVGFVDFDYLENRLILEKANFKNQNLILEEKEYSKFVYDNYLNLDSDVKSWVLDYIRDNNLEGKDLIDTINRMMAMFKKDFLYENREGMVPDINANDVLKHFLTISKLGDCSRFSGSSCLILRALGYPTRWTSGYGVHINDAYNETVVMGPDSHAIVQTYLSGKGWVNLDFTVAPINEGVTIPPPGDEYSKDVDITISTKDIIKTYDGKPINNSGDFDIKGTLNSGDKIYAYSTKTSLTFAGTVSNSVVYKIVNSSGADVTNKYKIREEFGCISVLEKNIVVETDNMTVDYDGSYHTSDFKVSGLISGDKISEFSSSEYRDIGEYRAYTSIKKIVNSKGEDVTTCYSISYRIGTIRIE